MRTVLLSATLLVFPSCAPIEEQVRPVRPVETGPTTDRLGVLLRCTGEEDPARALEAVRSLGLSRIQISKLPDRYYTPQGAAEFKQWLDEYRITADAVVVVFPGESYKDIETVRRTIGFRPIELQRERLAFARRCVDFAAEVGTGFVTFHMGYLPENPEDGTYLSMLKAVTEVAEYAATRNITISLETGQETGDELRRFLEAITTVRVCVNFDTANLILYGMDSSPQALRVLLDRVTSVHLKDGLPPADSASLGREARLGEGRGEVAECLAILHEAGFQGSLIIENYIWRELKTDPLDELRLAKGFVFESLARLSPLRSGASSALR